MMSASPVGLTTHVHRPWPMRILSKTSFILVGTLVVSLLPTSTSTSFARRSAGHSCSVGAHSRSLGSVSVAAGAGTLMTGSIRVARGRGGWRVQASLGRLPSYVSQAFKASRFISAEFCLRAPRRVAVTIVRLQPSGISLVLDKQASIQLVRDDRPTVHTPQRATLVGTSEHLVRMVIDGRRRRATLYVDGAQKQSLAIAATEETSVQIGSVAPVGPSPAPPTTVSLSTVNVSVGNGSVIPPTGNSNSTNLTMTSALWPGNPFSPTSFWNAPLAAKAPLDPNSSAYVDEVIRQVKAYGPWMNTTSYGVPVYVVPANARTQHVTLDTWGPDLQAEFDAVPVPTGAKAAAGTDEQMVVWQPATDKMWEFWQMHQESDGWHARWGGEMDNVSTNPGYFTHSGQTNNWGATATGLPLLGGLITEADLQRGYINHALAISLVETARAIWAWPAQRTDGGYWASGITPIPEGTRFRLDPNLNINSLHLPPIDRILAQAAQTYGIVVRDKAGAVVFYGQDPVNLGSNPWPATFGNQYPNNVLALFPWSHLEALQATHSCCWSP
jgi:hypothetical protein